MQNENVNLSGTTITVHTMSGSRRVSAISSIIAEFAVAVRANTGVEGNMAHRLPNDLYSGLKSVPL